MHVIELIGKKITNLCTIIREDDNFEMRLDFAECFIELDGDLIIDMPYPFGNEVWIKNLNPLAESYFADVKDYPVFHINEDKISVAEFKDIQTKRKRANPLFWWLFRDKSLEKYSKVYKTEYRENRFKYIKDAIIVDFLFDEDSDEKGFFLLDNGYIIKETVCSPTGTGLAGINIFDSLKDFENLNGTGYKRLININIPLD